MKRRRCQHRQTGFTLVEVLVATAAVGIVSLGVASLMSWTWNFNRVSNAATFLRNVMESYRVALLSTKGWEATVLEPSNIFLECLRPKPNPALAISPANGDCTHDLTGGASGRGIIDTIMNPAGTAPIFSRSSLNGFDDAGKPCGGAPSASCPYALNFTIQSLSCGSSVPTCIHSDVDIVGQISVFVDPDPNKMRRPSMNSNNYGLRVTRNGQIDFGGFCASMNGTWDPLSKKCLFNDGNCTDLTGPVGPDTFLNRYVAGIGTDWKVICSSVQCIPGTYLLNRTPSAAGAVCGPVDGVTCAVGERMVGIDADGKPQCVALADTECGVGNYFKGLDRNRKAICSPFSGTTACPAGKYVTDVNPNGNPVCKEVADTCNPGEVFEGFDTAGVKICTKNFVPKACAPGEMVREIASNGTPICEKVVPAGCSKNYVLKGHNSDGSAICVRNDVKNGDLVGGNHAGGDLKLFAYCTGSGAPDPNWEVVSCNCRCDSGKMRLCGAYTAGGSPVPTSYGCSVWCDYNGSNDYGEVWPICRAVEP